MKIFFLIQNWALKNQMTINKAKTKELVFRRPRPTKFDMPDPLDGIAYERATKLLGIILLVNWVLRITLILW